MRDTGFNIDLKAVALSLKENIGKLGGFSPEQVRQAATSDATLKSTVLAALSEGSKTGHEVMLALKETSRMGISPSAGRVYPLLENLTDQGLVTSSIKKDRKVYKITDEGRDALSSADPEAETETAGTNWPLPKWVDLTGEVPRASARLAAVAVDVAKNGTREQQQQAASIIDEARRQMHQLLSEK
jgi:DNA-binding PadR family transcriptional regulator